MLWRQSQFTKRSAITLLVALSIVTSWNGLVPDLSRAIAQERTYSTDDLTGTWTGKMMNIPQSVKGIEVTMTFTPDQATTKGTASFHNLDINNRATGTIAKIEVAKGVVKFPLLYRGGAPGVDGTTGHYELKFVSPDVLEGTSENYETRSFLRLRLEKQKS